MATGIAVVVSLTACLQPPELQAIKRERAKAPMIRAAVQILEP